MNTYETTIIKHDMVDESTLFLHIAKPEGFSYEAGQFIMLEHEGVKRAYSLYSSPEEDHLQLLIRIVTDGKLTGHLKEVRDETPVHFTGPFGRFTLKDSPRKKIFVALGTGLAPLRPMIVHLQQTGFADEMQLFYSVRVASQLAGNDEFVALAETNANFHYYPCVTRDDTWQGYQGRVQGILFEKLSDPAGHDYYLCGLTVAVKDITQQLLEKGVPKEQIFSESY
ncbi:MAG: FAD-dependent oxidoreductase [Candidatus Woesearchaeota archaeon]|nr:MAG: FAD-dependent oxidoreductase [Candidatus Woesearchaeota archaeon]